MSDNTDLPVDTLSHKAYRNREHRNTYKAIFPTVGIDLDAGLHRGM